MERWTRVRLIINSQRRRRWYLMFRLSTTARSDRGRYLLLVACARETRVWPLSVTVPPVHAYYANPGVRKDNAVTWIIKKKKKPIDIMLSVTYRNNWRSTIRHRHPGPSIFRSRGTIEPIYRGLSIVFSQMTKITSIE